MATPRSCALALLAGVLGIAGCGDATGSHATRFAFVDPVGDAINYNGQQGFIADVQHVSGVFGSDTLTIVIAFTAPVTHVSAGSSNGVGGGIEFDVDADSTTGRRSAARPSFGADFDLFFGHGRLEQPELMAIYPTAINSFDLGWAIGTFSENALTVRVPLAEFARMGRPARRQIRFGGSANTTAYIDPFPNVGVYTVLH